MSNLVKHAESELAIAGIAGDDGYDGMLYEGILRMVKLFAEEGHSGHSAAMTTAILTKLLQFEPLTPLTGQNDEWVEVADDLWQNKRASHVFKNDSGVAHDIDAIRLRDPQGETWSGYVEGVGWPRIAFPYTPATRTIAIDEHGRTIDRTESMYDKRGFCSDDGCTCWNGEN